MKGIKHIFFDLDHTLWDYDRNAQETLMEIYELLNIQEQGVEKRRFIRTFYEVNDRLWHQYNNGIINRDDIRNGRFVKFFEKIGADISSAGTASEYFMETCPAKTHLLPDTLTVLRYLVEKYRLHIITNGFEEVQYKKMSGAGIDHFFDVVVTSEMANSRKPSGEIFAFSLAKAGAQKGESIMIGDNPKTDIHGARDFGIRTILYDPTGKRRSMADHVIQSHMELIGLL